MTPRIESWPPRRFPFRTRLSTGEGVSIRSHIRPADNSRGGGVCRDLSIYVNDANSYYERVETLVHEFVHLAEEEMLRDGVIRRRSSIPYRVIPMTRVSCGRVSIA